MTKLFKFEYRRLFRQKSFWIFMAVAAALAFLSLGAFKLIEIATNITSDMNDVDTYFGIGYTGAEAFRNATSLGDIDIVIAIVAAIFVCSEYSRGTIKKVVSAGFSRCKIFTAEFLVSMTAAALVFVASSAVSYTHLDVYKRQPIIPVLPTHLYNAGIEKCKKSMFDVFCLSVGLSRRCSFPF